MFIRVCWQTGQGLIPKDQYFFYSPRRYISVSFFRYDMLSDRGKLVWGKWGIVADLEFMRHARDARNS